MFWHRKTIVTMAGSTDGIEPGMYLTDSRDEVYSITKILSNTSYQVRRVPKWRRIWWAWREEVSTWLRKYAARIRSR